MTLLYLNGETNFMFVGYSGIDCKKIWCMTIKMCLLCFETYSLHRELKIFLLLLLEEFTKSNIQLARVNAVKTHLDTFL